MTGDKRTESLAVVVGQNCKRIRTQHDVTLNALAKEAKDVGLRWSASKVGQFERGQYSPAFGTVLAVSIALSHATKTDVTPADLVAFDGFIEFNEDFKLTGSKVAAALRGEPWGVLLAEDTGISVDPEVIARAFAALANHPARYGALLVSDLDETLKRSGLDEERLAKRLGIDGHLLALASVYLWGKSFSDERDRLAGTDANAQKRGRVSRTLQKQLEKELARGDD